MTKSLWGRIVEAIWAPVSRRQVMTDLADTRWDWIRSATGLRLLIALSLGVMFVAPLAVWLLEDGPWFIPLILVAAIFGTRFLLRRAVRLVAQAPDSALDERLIAIRNHAYLQAYRAMASVIGVGTALLLAWSIIQIRQGVLAAELSMTWPQVNAALWFVIGQIVLWPSLILAITLHKRKVAL